MSPRLDQVRRLTDTFEMCLVRSAWAHDRTRPRRLLGGRHVGLNVVPAEPDAAPKSVSWKVESVHTVHTEGQVVCDLTGIREPVSAGQVIRLVRVFMLLSSK